MAAEKEEKNGEALPLSPNLFRELYPDLTPGEIMIKSLANLLLRGFSADEIKRFEFFLDERLAGKIDAATFEKYLDLPFREEGVGLWKQRAIKIASLTEDVIAEKKKLSDIYAELEKHPETPLTDEVSSLRAWITKEYQGHIDDTQRTRLSDAIAKRLRGSTTAEQFRQELNLARSQGGVGFSIRTTQRLSDRLESVLVLGHIEGNIKDAINSAAHG